MDPFYIQLYQKQQSQTDKLKIVNIFYELQEAKKFATIDKILGEININRIELSIILLIARCNQPIRKQLLFFDAFAEKAQNRFKDSAVLKLVLEKE